MNRFLLVILMALTVLPVFAEDGTTLTGKVLVAHVEGKPDVVTFKTDFADFTLLPCDKLTELLNTPGLADRTMEIVGSMLAAADGKTAVFTVRSFAEYVVPSPIEPTATPTAPASGSF